MKTKQKKTVKIVLIVVIILIAALVAAVGLMYEMNKNSYGFLKNTTLNGEDISGRSPEDVADELASEFKNPEVKLTENDQTVLEGTLGDFGYTFNKGKLTETLNQALTQQKSGFVSVMRTLVSGETLTVETAYDFDQNQFDNEVTSASFSVPRVKSQEASVQLNSDTNTYEVVQAVQGNEIDDNALRKAVKAELDKDTASGDTSSDISIPIPDSVYTSEKVSTDTSALETEAQQKNKELMLQEYKDMVITYTFGDETKQLTSDTFMDWLTIGDDGTVSIDEDKVKAYVNDLANEYNTRHLDRQFTTTGGQTITIPASNNEYGYIIDGDAETEQLMNDLKNKQSVTREPEYVKTNDYGNPYYYGRNGKDDLAGNYVEVDLTKQHLWMYSGGNLVVESDLVSGNLSKNQGTMTGVFPLAYKESPSVLKGANYETKVNYWMPFYEGEGLHDASWRSAFGGDIYKTNGSNGCLNLPPDVAQKIFENIDAGYAIVIYYEPGTEPDASTYARDATDVADNPADYQ